MLPYTIWLYLEGGEKLEGRVDVGADDAHHKGSENGKDLTVVEAIEWRRTGQHFQQLHLSISVRRITRAKIC